MSLPGGLESGRSSRPADLPHGSEERPEWGSGAGFGGDILFFGAFCRGGMDLYLDLSPCQLIADTTKSARATLAVYA